MEKGYHRIRSFKGGCDFRIYLSTVIANLARDGKDRKWGKWRPCEAAKRLGEAAIRVDTLLNRDGLSFDHARARLATEGFEMNAEELERLAATFPQRARRREVSDEVLAEHAAPDPAPDQALAQKQALDRKDLVMQALRAEIEALGDPERLAMRLILDGVKAAVIAPLLGLEPNAIYPFVQRAKAVLREQLEARGFGPGDVGDVLE